MATKAMSEMTDAELRSLRDAFLHEPVTAMSSTVEYRVTLILANQYDAELTRRREGKTI